MTERSDAHLEPAVIAALVDRTLDPAARAAAEAHLAECADCREVWVETIEMVSAIETATASEPAREVVVAAKPSKRRSWIYAGAGLAAAAMVALAVFSPTLFNRGERPELRELVEAVGTNRRTEARLTGGFQWGPVPSVTRGTASEVPIAIEAAANRLAAAPFSTVAESEAGKGRAALVLGDVAGGLEHTNRAVELDPSNAAYWSDLGVAHLEEFRLQGTPQALSGALAAFDRAAQLDPQLPEVLFNRALALEHLGDHSGAQSAWQTYLTVDSGSPWAAEAHARLKRAPR